MNDSSCPHCGQAHPTGARFCPVSGKPLPEMQTCPNCGRRLREAWKVCPQCGKQLEKEPRRKRWIWAAIAIGSLSLLIAGGYLAMGNQASKSSVIQETRNNPTAESTSATVIPNGDQSELGTIMPRATALLAPTLTPNIKEVSRLPNVTTSLSPTNTPILEVIRLSSLVIDLWPEYDQPTMLVIYRIKLPPTISLPVDLTFRIPAAAGDPSAVAVRQMTPESDSGLFSIPYQLALVGDWSMITITATAPDIQLEYYDPGLIKQGDTRHFEYRWPGDYAIDALILQVQQPMGASELRISPAADAGVSGNDGLTYNTINAGSLNTNQTFSLSLDYEKYSDTLSAIHMTTGRMSGDPQGKVVFTCQTFKDPKRNQICLINADGSGWKRLSSDDNADHTYPSFSPDGQNIVFAKEIDDDHQIFEMDLAGNQRRLTDLTFGAYAPAISADNRWIVFTANDGSHQTLWIMDRDGANPHALTYGNEGDAWDPVWSSDGKQILFASDRADGIQLFVMDADGSNHRQITKIDSLRGRSDWAPDGEVIVTYAGSSWHREIIILGKDGKQLEQITNGGNNLAPNFSPDGEWIAFTSYKDNYGNDNGCEIYVMRNDGSQVTRLTKNDYCDWQPNWGP